MKNCILSIGILFFILCTSGIVLAAPEIEVHDYYDNDLVCGASSVSLGTTDVGRYGTSCDFTIINTGNSNLTLNGNPNLVYVSGGDALMFSVDTSSTSSTVAPGVANSTFFTIAFNPTSAGIKSSTVYIPNDDGDENPFTFTVTGYATYPEIDLKQGATNIPSGGTFDLPNAPVDADGTPVTFKIDNPGTSTLYLNPGDQQIFISGADSSMFIINESNTYYWVSSGYYATFTIAFAPTSKGLKTATITIPNNDINENPYTFTVRGVGFDKTFDFNGDGYNDVIVGAPNDDDGGTNSGCAFIYYGGPSADATWDVKLVGAEAGSHFEVVCCAGRLNDDTYDDVVIGAWNESDHGYSNNGCIYIFFGSNYSSNTTINASLADDPINEDVVVKRFGVCDGEYFGTSISAVGDVNNDGRDDFIVGAPGNDENANNAGVAYLYYGRDFWDTGWGSNVCSVCFYGENANMGLGMAVGGGGNVDGDMYDCDDIIIGSQNSDTYVIYGENWPGITHLNLPADADIVIQPVSGSDYFGYTVTTAVNVNNDDYYDIIIGAKGADGGGTDRGAVYIFLGDGSLSSTLDASTDADYVIYGENNYDMFGCSVSYAGDVNNDGYDDFIVGAYYDDNGGASSGCAFIFFGASSLTASDSDDADVKLIGADAGDLFGSFVANAGDFDCDGYDDVIVGAPNDDNGGADSGCVFIFYGSNGWNPVSAIDASNADKTFVGVSAGDNFGAFVDGGT